MGIGTGKLLHAAMQGVGAECPLFLSQGIVDEGEECPVIVGNALQQRVVVVAEFSHLFHLVCSREGYFVGGFYGAFQFYLVAVLGVERDYALACLGGDFDAGHLLANAFVFGLSLLDEDRVDGDALFQLFLPEVEVALLGHIKLGGDGETLFLLSPAGGEKKGEE